VAIAATAIVHLVNNIFKSVLIGKKANWHVVLKFALPGTLAAIIGAFLLNLLSNIPAIKMYRIGNSSHEINVIYGLVLATSLAAITGSIARNSNIKKNYNEGNTVSSRYNAYYLSCWYDLWFDIG